MRRAEMAVTGCDYGATSYTTRDQASRLAQELALGPGALLLDIGSGAGWPGIYLSRSTGCRVVLTDPSFEGLNVAARRMRAEGVSGAVINASGEALPFQDGVFDAVTHSDVLCCLPAKQAVLRDNRRVLRKGGRLSFLVIELTEGISDASRVEVAASGPDHIEADDLYQVLMARAGFERIESMDVTEEYRETLSALIRTWDEASTELAPIVGIAEFEDRQSRRNRALAEVDEGSIRRTLFTAYRG
ncbi:MAG TPA: methyltransferase domain-containing protein [Acidimicrobiia bacterium]|nr:methyltransferase domain-containing protein [Acidimicrobiia bacterium]